LFVTTAQIRLATGVVRHVQSAFAAQWQSMLYLSTRLNTDGAAPKHAVGWLPTALPKPASMSSGESTGRR
jgi:hypothetical protein